MGALGLILVALVGLGIGVWFGMPGRYTQRPEDIEKLMDQGGGTRQPLTKRSISPIAWLQRNVSPRSSTRSKRQPKRRGGFKLESPEDR